MTDDEPSSRQLSEEIAALREQVAAQTDLLHSLRDDVRSITAQGGSGLGLWQRLGLADGERRRVTVLFADVSGFTGLAETLDPEECTIVMRDTLAGLADEVRSQGGHVEKFIGDAVCAIYGAPEAHENEPERAVRSALAMHALMAARAVDRPDLPPLTVHIGINTGVVVAGPLADGTQVGVMGDTVNTAARLMDAAESTQTLVSAETARWIRRRFVLEEAGELVLKNKAIPIHASFVIREMTDEETIATRVLKAPLIGRDAELAQLRETAASVVATGSGRTVVLLGAGGTGKARLIEEVLSEFDREMTVIRGSARDVQGRALGVVATALEPLLAGAPLTPASDIVRTLYGEQVSDDLWRAVAQFVIERAAERPLVVLFEELEAADPASLELLRFLAQSTVAAPILWLASARPGVLGVAALAAEPTTTRIELSPLGDESVSALFELLLPGALTEQQRGELATRAAGNPEFAEELALALVEEGIVSQAGDGRWAVVGDVNDLAVPPTLHEFIEARIDVLPDHARMVLQEASVVGEQFRWDVLSQVTSVPSLLDAALAELVSAEFVRPPSVVGIPGVYAFRGSLLREVAYSSILDSRRANVHRRVGESKARLHRDNLAPVAERLAFHFEAAGDAARALEFLMIAAEHAHVTHASASLSELVDRGLQLCQRDPEGFSESALRLRQWGEDLAGDRSPSANVGGSA